jgi:hypothetical protein
LCDVVSGGMTVEAAARRADEIFAKYPINES